MEGWGSQRETRRCKRGTHVGSKTEQPRDLREYEAYFFFVSRHFSISFLLFHLLILLICNSYAPQSTIPFSLNPQFLLSQYFIPSFLASSILHPPSYSSYFFTISPSPLLLQSSSISSFSLSYPLLLSTLFPTFYNFLFPIFQLQSSLLSSNLHSSSTSFSSPCHHPFLALLPLSLSLSIPVLSRLTSSTPPLLPLTQTRRKTREPMPPRRWIMDFERSHASYPRLNIHNAFLRHVIRSCTIQPRSTGRARARETPRHRVWTNDDNRCIHGNNTVVHRGVDDTGKLLLLLFLFGACCFEYEIIRAETTRGSRPTFTVWIWSHLATRLLVHVFLLD